MIATFIWTTVWEQETQLSLTNRATRLEVSQGHQIWYHSTLLGMVSLLVSYSNFVSKTAR